jgi:hypothetical protein
LLPAFPPGSYALQTTDAGDSLPHAQALHPTLPGPDRFRVEENEERNDYTVSSLDLSRWARGGWARQQRAAVARTAVRRRWRWDGAAGAAARWMLLSL